MAPADIRTHPGIDPETASKASPEPLGEAERLTGIELIAAERQRQIDEEGWSESHDDWHERGELAEAAACYATQTHFTNGNLRASTPPRRWPWDDEWWKPSEDRIRNLVKAGALIAAEIDRLQRAATDRREPGEGSE